MTSRVLALVVSVLALAIGWPSSAHAADVVVFDDPAYVDSVGGLSSESDTIQASLVAQGHTVTTFTGTSAAAWTAALAGKDLLVIPEQEVGSLAPAIAGPTLSALQAFISAGGGLIVAGTFANRSSALLNAVLGASILESGGGGGALLTGAAAGTAFAGGPATLPAPSATAYLMVSSLPPGSLSIYAEATTRSYVAQFAFGSGKVIYLGWDWFNAQPLGSQDGGWLAVLGSAVTEIGTSPAPTVTCTTSVSALQPWGGGLVNVGLTVTSSDPSATKSITVYSNEPNLTGTTTSFFFGGAYYYPKPVAAQLVGSSLFLRADRYAQPGRVYLIVAKATNAGGTGFASTTVVVPYSPFFGAPPAAIATAAAGAKAYCDANAGAPPPGLVPPAGTGGYSPHLGPAPLP